MSEFNINNSYWNGNGRHQDKLNELVAAGEKVPGLHTYNRYYDTGEIPITIKDSPFINDSYDVKDVFMENWLDKKILQAYLKFKKGLNNGNS